MTRAARRRTHEVRAADTGRLQSAARRHIEWIAVLTFASSIASPQLPVQAREPVRHHKIDGAEHVPPTLPGIVEPSRQVTLSSPFDGVLSRVLVQEGSRVRRGQLVATMDDDVARASVAVAQAATNRKARIARAESELDLARSYLDRLLRTRDVASEHALDQARAAVKTAQSELNLAREQHREALATLRLQQARLEEHNIRAPFDGLVTRIDARAGETLAQTAPIVTIINLDELQVDLHLPLRWYGTVRPGDCCVLQAEAPVNREVQATIQSVEPRINAATRTFRCVVRIENRNHELPAGFSVQLRHVRPCDTTQTPAIREQDGRDDGDTRSDNPTLE